jgi:hypothetical protein
MTSLLGTATTTEGSPTPAATGSSPAAEVTGQKPAATAQEPANGATDAAPAQQAAGTEKPKDGATEAAKTEAEAPKSWKPEDYKLKDGDEDYADDEFAGLASKAGLPPEAAQQVLSHLAPKIREAQIAKAQAEVNALAEKLATAAKADKEIGGENLPKFLADANRAFQELPGGDKVKEMLSGSPHGSDPDVIRFVAAVGRMLKPDTEVVKGASADGTTRSLFDRLVEANRQNVGS